MKTPAAPADGAVCPQCEYDLRGNTSNRCPECGLAFDLPSLIHVNRSRWECEAARAERTCVLNAGVALSLLLFSWRQGAGGLMAVFVPCCILAICLTGRWMVEKNMARSPGVEFVWRWCGRGAIGSAGYLAALAAMHLLHWIGRGAPVLIGMASAAIGIEAWWRMRRSEFVAMGLVVQKAEYASARRWWMSCLWMAGATLLAGMAAAS